MKLFLVRIILSIIALSSLNIYAQNPNWEWVNIGGGSGKDAGQKIAIDSQGNVYVLGSFRDNNIVLGSTTLTNAGDDDVFLAKYSSLGSLIWAKSIGNTGTETATSLIINKYDDIYVSGGFSSSTITIGTTTLPNSGGFDFFIVKYNSSGQVLWAKNSSNSNFNAGIIAIDDNLNSYSARTTTTTAIIDKFNSANILQWSKTITTTGSISTVSIRGMTVDTSGIYFTGDFFGTTLTIETTTLTNSVAQNSNDMYVARLDTSGNLLWAKNAICNAGDLGKDIEVDVYGNVYVLGNFSSVSLFDSFSITSNGENDIFLVKYSSVGQVLWAKNAGGIYNDWVVGLEIDASGAAYIIGEFYSPNFTFANTTHNNAGAAFSYADVYILKYGSLGNESWIKSIQGLGNDNGSDVVVNNIGEVYVTGAVEDTVGGTTNVGSFPLVSYGLDDIFIAKLSSTLSITDRLKSNSLSIYPNPTQNILNVSYKNNNLTTSVFILYDITGRTVKTQTYQPQQEGLQNFSVDLQNLKEGTYFYTFQVGTQTKNGKVVKMNN